MTERLQKAKEILTSVKGKQLTVAERSQLSIKLAGLLLDEANVTAKSKELNLQAELARMMDDPMGKAFTTAMADEGFRSHVPSRTVDQLIFLIKKYGIPRYLSFIKRTQLFFFKWIGPLFPSFLIPLVRKKLRKETSSVIMLGEPEDLIQHIQQRQKEGIRINLNHLGEAILGEQEAMHRLDIYLNDLANPEIEYISVKISTICSQLNLLSWQETLAILCKRLKLLYRAARDHTFIRRDGTAISKFVNLDMEEYRDLHLTVEAFQQTLEDPEFYALSAGIVLQSYLPDSYPIQQRLSAWARQRVAAGGAPIKIRIVKGANLAMEQVEASLRGWAQAPYPTKAEVDANFKRMVIFGCAAENAAAVNLGIGSHNLFDIAHAMILRAENQVEKYVTFEMLEGMAEQIRRVVQEVSGGMLLYCPAATEEEFQNAVAYLTRRLDENTAPENFLRHLFGLVTNTPEWNHQSALFLKSCEDMQQVYAGPRRIQNRQVEPLHPEIRAFFENEADTDWSLRQNRMWIESHLHQWASRIHPIVPLVIGEEEIITKDKLGIGEDPAHPKKILYQYSLANQDHLEKALRIASNAAMQWQETTIDERNSLLAEVAQKMRQHRADLIAAMVADTGKTVAEADVEVSEAIDFAEYYRLSAKEWLALPDIKWRPKGTVLVAPPWNFPCSIPAGGILAALIAGNCVIFKPAAESVLVGWQLVRIFWEAGISKKVLQFITCEDEPVGSMLVRDPRIACVVLTGATDTAKLMLRLRPGLDLVAETGGKNAMIISNMSDRDLAVKDLVQSAFGHAGQKCSACSLAICHAEVYDDPQFRKQLRDAAASLQVGSQWDLSTRINPLIRTPNPVLMRGLTTLDDGEEWLLEPKVDPHNPNLWSPGIKLGVQPGSFTHQNELFGPVLGLMRAESLKQAVKLANGTRYGLTSGIHSLDEREQDYWSQNVESGNCYINRGITGAVVRRQPFGGCKESSFGFGAKAGGPNYVTQLMIPSQAVLPQQTSRIPEVLQPLTHYLLKNGGLGDVWESSLASYQFFKETYFDKKHDPSKVLGQDNYLMYRSHPHVLFRIQSQDALKDVLRVIAAAIICKTPLEVSGDPIMPDLMILKLPNVKFIPETEKHLIARLEKNGIRRMRLISAPSEELQNALANNAINVNLAPVLANGRLELLHYLREMSLSFDYHRYGYLGKREVN